MNENEEMVEPLFSDNTKDAKARATSDAERKRRRARRRGIRAAFYAVTCLVVLTVVALVLINVLFVADAVTVENTSPYTAAELMDTVAFRPHDRVLAVRKDLLDGITERFPYVDNAEVSVSLPFSVTFTFRAATPIFALKTDDAVYELDRSFKVLCRRDDVPEGLLPVYGIDAVGAVPGQVLDDRDNVELSVLDELCALLEKQGHFADADYVDFTKIYNIRLCFNDTLTVELGTSENLETKLQRAFDIYEMPENVGRKATVNVKNPDEVRYLPQ